MTLVGRLETAQQGVLRFAPDLATDLANGDAYYAAFFDMADAHVEQHGLEMPWDAAARAVLPDPRYLTEPIRSLDLRSEGVGAVIWATGYRVDFGWIELPVLDARGAPVHRQGVTEAPGLYFLGLSWQFNLNSSFLSGVGDDADVLADHIAARG